MPVFTRSLRKIDYSNQQSALKEMENQIRYIQEQLEYTLLNLDSSNITEIDTDSTNITSGSGGVTISKDAISLAGKNGEVFRAGHDASSGQFVFEVRGKDGVQAMFLSSSGEMIITKSAAISIDCGEW